MITTSLYFIKDKAADVPMTGVIAVMNDLVALRGFIEFLKKDDCKPEEYDLIRIGTMDDEYYIYETRQELVSNGEFAEDTYKELFAAKVSKDKSEVK